MDREDLLNITVAPKDMQVSMNMRDAFEKWLADDNKCQYLADILPCIDKISDFAIRKKISKASLWEYTDYNAFNCVYDKLIEMRFFRITARKAYKVFNIAGRLYMDYLKSISSDVSESIVHAKKLANESIQAINSSIDSEEDLSKLDLNETQPLKSMSNMERDKGEIVSIETEKPTSESIHTPDEAADPEKIIKQIIQQNASKSRYVCQCMNVFCDSLSKLKVPGDVGARNVFACHNTDELKRYWNIFRSAPNFEQINCETSGMFYSGMRYLWRYVKTFSETSSDEEDDAVLQLVKNLKLEYVDKRRSSGALWVIGGRELTTTMNRLRDLGVHFLFKEGGGRSTGYKDAWWYKPSHRAKPKESVVVQQTQDYSSPNYVGPVVLSKHTLDPTVIEKITSILLKHFANGFRLNSPIELTRFRTFALNDLGEDILIPNEVLESYISACGTIFEGKVYVVSEETKNQIRELVVDYFSTGAQVIFYSEFYAKHENWLFNASVISEDMLIEILRSLFPGLTFTQTYFGYIDSSVLTVLEKEILRVWGDDILLTYDQLSERLPYIPIERIKYALVQNANFIWNSMETFSHISRIDINEDEREAIREFAERECNTHGYLPIMYLPLENIKERNYELSTTALYNAVYNICLSDKFNKKGRIITRQGNVVDAMTIMKDYCRTINKCSLNDLFNYEKEQTGDLQRWVSLEAANTFLVRVDKDTYVADKFVRFDVDLIDKAIELGVKDDYLPLKSFISFGFFPDCGQTWNLFLLESYCRRFSRKFRFDTQTVNSVNSRNIGVVVRNSCNMNYIKIMSDAVAKSNVPLNDADVGRFLFVNGYTGTSKNGKILEIIEMAKAMRERRS